MQVDILSYIYIVREVLTRLRQISWSYSRYMFLRMSLPAKLTYIAWK
jgi:hypothetical protein